MDAFEQKKQVSYEKPYRMWESESYQFPLHWHDEYEIIYLYEGQHQYKVDNVVYNLKKGDILIVTPCAIHQYLPNYFHNKAIMIQFNDYFLMKGLDYSWNLKLKEPYIKKDLQNPIYVHMKEAIETAILEYKEKERAYEFAIGIEISKILLTIMREMEWEPFTHSEKETRDKNLMRIEKVFEYIEDNYFEEITLEKAASICNFSKYHFSRFFKKTTGVTFKQYLDHIRLEKAKKFLGKTDASVTEIAISVGFSSINSFVRAFRRVTNMTPTDYRKKM